MFINFSSFVFVEVIHQEFIPWEFGLNSIVEDIKLYFLKP